MCVSVLSKSRIFRQLWIKQLSQRELHRGSVELMVISWTTNDIASREMGTLCIHMYIYIYMFFLYVYIYIYNHSIYIDTFIYWFIYIYILIYTDLYWFISLICMWAVCNTFPFLNHFFVRGRRFYIYIWIYILSRYMFINCIHYTYTTLNWFQTVHIHGYA